MTELSPVGMISKKLPNLAVNKCTENARLVYQGETSDGRIEYLYRRYEDGGVNLLSRNTASSIIDPDTNNDAIFAPVCRQSGSLVSIPKVFEGDSDVTELVNPSTIESDIRKVYSEHPKQDTPFYNLDLANKFYDYLKYKPEPDFNLTIPSLKI